MDRAKSFISRRSKSIKPKHKEPDVFAGKLNFGRDSAEIDSSDLEVPTIYRVKKPLSQLDLDNEEENVNSGFIFNSNKLNWSKDKSQKEVEQQKANDEEDSSSFLRMIMD